MTNQLSSSRSTFLRSFFRMTLTIALQNLIVYGVNLADNIMIGAYSEPAMSGVALVNQIQFLLQMLVSGAGEGVVVLASRAWGRGDIGEVKRASSVGMRFGLGAAALLFAVLLLFPYQVLRLLTPEEAVISEGV
ncbi:MAG: MATE family efflux transporter, partial [Clostridia bacterium]|nr:MATE family efflux transporter [Clostridia bacterium]